MRRLIAGTAVGALTGVLALTGCGSSGSIGRQIFLSAGCGRCHALRAAGTRGALGPNLDSARPSRFVARRWMTYGAGGMPSYAGVLTPRQIDQVVAFVVATTR